MVHAGVVKAVVEGQVDEAVRRSRGRRDRTAVGEHAGGVARAVVGGVDVGVEARVVVGVDRDLGLARPAAAEGLVVDVPGDVGHCTGEAEVVNHGEELGAEALVNGQAADVEGVVSSGGNAGGGDDSDDRGLHVWSPNLFIRIFRAAEQPHKMAEQLMLARP